MTYRPKTPSWPYHVDEESKTVWMEVDSWMKAQAAPHLVKLYFGPDYKPMFASVEKIKELNEST